MKTEALALHGSLLKKWDSEPMVLRITMRRDCAEPHRHLYLSENARDCAPEFPCWLHREPCNNSGWSLPTSLSYLEEGDVVRINPRAADVWVMYRRNSPSNSMLLTERCNSWCVMCSQPPKPKDDFGLLDSWRMAIPLMDPATKEIGITGGEPTLLGGDFLSIVELLKNHLPQTALHVLSNGRMFNYLTLAKAFADVRPIDTMIGIPLYSDIAWQHDFVVQSQGAFDQTIRGIMNLARCNVPVEIRVVLTRHTAQWLSRLCQFISRNLPFVQHVALMGLEPIGFAKANYEALWADPVDYSPQLLDGVQILDGAGLSTSIFNHQLCTIPRELWKYARRSISDWKAIFLPECSQCGVRSHCGGFFHSAVTKHSRAVAPIEEEMDDADLD